jgi:hypothetical protein
MAKPKQASLRTTPVEDLSLHEAQSEHDSLSAEIAGHDRRYYQEDAPSVSDAEYDALRQRYEALEARFPELGGEESLSRRVGARASEKFAKVRHRAPMLSLANGFSDEDVSAFVEHLVHEPPEAQVETGLGFLLLSVAVGAMGLENGADVLFKRQFRRRREGNGGREKQDGGQSLHGRHRGIPSQRRERTQYCLRNRVN